MTTTGQGTFGNLVIDNVKIDGNRIGFKDNNDYILFSNSIVRFETNINIISNKSYNIDNKIVLSEDTLGTTG